MKYSRENVSLVLLPLSLPLYFSFLFFPPSLLSLLPSSLPAFFLYYFFLISSLCFLCSEKFTDHLKTGRSLTWQVVYVFQLGLSMMSPGLFDAGASQTWVLRRSILGDRRGKRLVLKAWTGRLVLCHFCHILLVKAVTKLSWIRGERSIVPTVNEKSFKKCVVIFNSQQLAFSALLSKMFCIPSNSYLVFFFCLTFR